MKIWKLGRKYIAAFAILTLLVVVVFLFYRDGGRIFNQENIANLVQDWGLLGLAVLLLFQFTHVILVVIPGQLLILAIAYSYGFENGFLINWISICSASQLAFILARKYGRPFVSKVAPLDALNNWDSLAQKYGLPFFFLMFVFPLGPGDLLNYVAGLTKMKSRNFFGINFIGKAPQIFALSWAGSEITRYSPSLKTFYSIALALLTILLLFLIARKLIRKKFGEFENEC